MDKPIKQSSVTVASEILGSKEWHSRATCLLVGMLMVAIYLWIVAGFIILLLDLYRAAVHDWSHAAESMIKQMVILLASLELVRTLNSYLLIGRVRVTFILDVALVVLIGELISLWYRDYSTAEVITSVFVISALVVLRIVTARYSPDDNHNEPDQFNISS